MDKEAEQKPAKCRICLGRGYIPCDCWPCDCICNDGDEHCEACDGSGIEGYEWEDYP